MKMILKTNYTFPLPISFEACVSENFESGEKSGLRHKKGEALNIILLCISILSSNASALLIKCTYPAYQSS